MVEFPHVQRPYRHFQNQSYLGLHQGLQQEPSPDCSSSLSSGCSHHHHQTPCQAPCWQQLLNGDVLSWQPASGVTGKPKHSNESRQQLPGSSGIAQLQQVVRHHPLLLLLQHPSQQELQQQRETSQQQELQQQAPRNPVLQRWQWSGPSRSCPRSHWPKCSSSYEGARCLRCRRNRFMQVCDSAWLLSASSSIRHAGNKLHPLQQVQAHSNSTSSRPVNRNHNSSSSPLAHSSSSSRDHAGQLALLDSSRRLHSSSNSRLNSTPHLNHHLRTHQQVAKQLCRQWWRALSSPGIIWGPEHCSAATAMPSCGHRRTRAQ